MAPKNVQVLILWNCEYDSFTKGKRKFITVIKDPEMGNFIGLLSGQTQCNHKGPYKREIEASESEKEMWRGRGDKERWAKDYYRPAEAGRHQEMDSPLE